MCRVQNVIASHESTGLDIIIALLLSDINPLRKQRIDLVLQLKVRASSVHLIYVSPRSIASPQWPDHVAWATGNKSVWFDNELA